MRIVTEAHDGKAGIYGAVVTEGIVRQVAMRSLCWIDPGNQGCLWTKSSGTAFRCAGAGGNNKIMKIVDMRVHSIAMADPPLRSSYGLHAPYALRNVLEIESEDGLVSVSRRRTVGRNPRRRLLEARDQDSGCQPLPVDRGSDSVSSKVRAVGSIARRRTTFPEKTLSTRAAARIPRSRPPVST